VVRSSAASDVYKRQIIERLWFWASLLTKEKQIVHRILDAARSDWGAANEIARQANRQPIGRFLSAPLRLYNPEPELFRLALEAAADEELASMRRGDKILEATIALAPLLGLLGTVLGLMNSINSIGGDLSTQAMKGVTDGISTSLITTATGMVVAIFTLAFYRIFQAFLFDQAKIFRKAGNELELLYRQYWPAANAKGRSKDAEYSNSSFGSDGLNKRSLNYQPEPEERNGEPKPKLKGSDPDIDSSSNN
jgi:biopolymer transport protein ExbB